MGNGRGGEGSLTSTMRPAGKGLGGEGSCETGTFLDVGMGAGRAMHPVMQMPTAEERIESFIVTLSRAKGRMFDESLRI